MTARETFIAGDREFAFHKIPAFQANGILLRLQKTALPIIGGLTAAANGDAKSILDMDLRAAADVIALHVDESLMTEIIMPMFKLAQVICVTDQKKIDSEAAFNAVFTVDQLGDFYELVFQVLRYNFGTFFLSLADRFGLQNGLPATPISTANASAN
ncbi:MAG: phage tail assembly chaperone [Burkholderiaceae bacterium]